ncbi:MAG TPA: hypothetical protein VHD95_07475 [Rhizomicrobium sp.]|nr:hypothetical protein [Rhizomicrobium sp.]
MPNTCAAAIAPIIFSKKNSNMNEIESQHLPFDSSARTIASPHFVFFQSFNPPQRNAAFSSRKISHGTCSATLFRAYSLNPKNCDEAKRPGQNRGVIVSTYPVAGRRKARRLFVLEKPKMPSDACSPGHRSDAVIVAALQKLWTITLDDIKSDWMDLMVKRLFSELNRQLLRIENQKLEQDFDGATRLQNARTLASLQRTLKELSHLERERDARRESKVKKTNARKTLESRLDQLSGRTAKAGVPDESK